MLWRPVQLWTPLWDDLFCRCMHSSQHTKFMRNRCPSRRWRPPFVRIWACIVSAPRNFTSYGLITGPVSAIIHSIIYHIHTIIMWMCFNLGPLFISHTFLGGRPIRMYWDSEKGAHHRKRHIDKLNASRKCDLTSLKWTLKRNKTENLTYRSIAQILHFAHQMNAFAHQSGDIRWYSCIKIWSGAWRWKFL